MKTTGIEYRRTVSDGNYGNWRYGIWGEVEEGETYEQAHTIARHQVNGQIERDQAAEKALEEAERAAHEPWHVTPNMVQFEATLRDRAMLAARIDAEHDKYNTLQRAHDAVLARFGLDLTFTHGEGGDLIAEVDGVLLVYHYNELQLIVPLRNGEKAQLTYVRSLEELGRKWAKAERDAGVALTDDIPF